MFQGILIGLIASHGSTVTERVADCVECAVKDLSIRLVGQTLIRGHNLKLKHSPQYYPPDPVFPLQREIESMSK